jgi:SAM-dependent methyltransferase
MASIDNDAGMQQYRHRRSRHWDAVSSQRVRMRPLSRHYQELLKHYYRFFVSPQSRVLELGCGHGHLLAALKPSRGVGIDFSPQMIAAASAYYTNLEFICDDVHAFQYARLQTTFDVIILSDLVNDLWDVQHVLQSLKPVLHPGTRVIINYFNNLWHLPLSLARAMGLATRLCPQNWFAPDDVAQIFKLAGYEVIQRRPAILVPLRRGWLSAVLNRYLVHLWPLHWFALTNFTIARPFSGPQERPLPKVSVVVAARNEEGNIASVVHRLPALGVQTELIFVEGHSDDRTFEAIEAVIAKYPQHDIKRFKQAGRGKGDAIHLGIGHAHGDIIMILDADLSVPPEALIRFLEAIVSNTGEFINGVRLVYPMEDQAMRWLNLIANKFFSLAFTWLLNQPIKDTLCGTKVFWKKDYDRIARSRDYFGDFDPYGDFDLLFGAARLNLKMIDLPVRYRARTYGKTNIRRWRHGLLLLRMVFFAAKRIRFI